MTELITNCVPRGEAAARQLVAAVCERGDTVERHYLEVKSDVDLRAKSGQAKLAKFILGAANRRPEVAAQAFDGYAIMIIGVSAGRADGNPPIEMMEVERSIEPYLSVDGPHWDFIRLPLATGNEILIVIVDPPTPGDPIRVCYKSGLNITDGAIYFRADGATRNATGKEIDQLVARAQVKNSEAAVVIRANGAATYVSCSNEETLEAYISKVSDRHSLAYDLANAPRNTLPGLRGVATLQDFGIRAPIGQNPEPRTRERYDEELEGWAMEMRAIWDQVVEDETARRLPYTFFTVENTTDIFLEDVEVKLHLEGDVDAVEWDDGDGAGMADYLPKPPRPWGPVPMFATSDYSHVQYAASLPYTPAAPRATSFRNTGSVEIDMVVGDLRPQRTWSSEGDDMVLVLRIPEMTSVNGTWTMTARNHNRVYSGTLAVPATEPLDLTSTIRQAIMTRSNE